MDLSTGLNFNLDPYTIPIRSLWILLAANLDRCLNFLPFLFFGSADFSSFRPYLFGFSGPVPSQLLNSTLPPYCMFANNGSPKNNICGLLCTVTSTVAKGCKVR